MLSGAAWSAGSLIAFRIVQGIGGGIILPVGQTMLARAAGPQRMGRVMSVVAVPALLGPVLGPVIGGLLIDAISWRWIFYVNVPIGIVALLAAWRWLEPDPHRRPDAPIDAVGVALLSPGLAAFIYGISAAGSAGLGSTQAVAGMVAGARSSRPSSSTRCARATRCSTCGCSPTASSAPAARRCSSSPSRCSR